MELVDGEGAGVMDLTDEPNLFVFPAETPIQTLGCYIHEPGIVRLITNAFYDPNTLTSAGVGKLPCPSYSGLLGDIDAPEEGYDFKAGFSAIGPIIGASGGMMQ